MSKAIKIRKKKKVEAKGGGKGKKNQCLLEIASRRHRGNRSRDLTLNNVNTVNATKLYTENGYSGESDGLCFYHIKERNREACVHLWADREADIKPDSVSGVHACRLCHTSSLTSADDAVQHDCLAHQPNLQVIHLEVPPLQRGLHAGAPENPFQVAVSMNKKRYSPHRSQNKALRGKGSVRMPPPAVAASRRSELEAVLSRQSSVPGHRILVRSYRQGGPDERKRADLYFSAVNPCQFISMQFNYFVSMWPGTRVQRWVRVPAREELRVESSS